MQSEEGYVSPRGIELCADLLDLTTAEVSGVATFYTQYKRHPNGDYTVGVCTNTLCAVMGGDQIFDELSDYLGVDHDETTDDGKITLERVECNAACDFAPVLMVNWEFFDNQTPTTARRLVDDIKADKPLVPTRGANTVCTFKQMSRVLAGFDDGRADEGVGANGATLEGLKLARQRGWSVRRPVRRGLPSYQRFWPARARAPVVPVEQIADGARGRPGRSQRPRRGIRRSVRTRPPQAHHEAEGRAVMTGEPTTLTPIFTEFWDDPQSWTMETYERHDGYVALRQALDMPQADLVQALKDSGLRGRGGAGFPTGMKWGFLPPPDGGPRYLVVNADESEPGTCKDIPLMLATPQFLIEGVIITAIAIGCNHAFIYVRGEVLHVYRRLLRAVEEAKAKGYLGKNILGSGFDLEITVHAGAGAYICGEETALLDSLEGRRGQPRLKPPFPAVAGLYARPTVVNNVESIASVPFIVRKGADWFASMGTERSKGFGLFSLSGHVTRPGPVRSTARHHAARAARHGRRDARRQEAEVLDAGGFVHTVVD